MISIEISKEAILNKKVLQATIEFLQLLGQDSSSGLDASSHDREPKPTSGHSDKRSLLHDSGTELTSTKKLKRRTPKKKLSKKAYHLPKTQLQHWISNLEVQQQTFVHLLRERGQLSLEEIASEVGLVLDPNKDRVKMINGFVGSIARWSSKSLDKNQKLIVPWECKDKVYRWKEDLLE